MQLYYQHKDIYAIIDAVILKSGINNEYLYDFNDQLQKINIKFCKLYKCKQKKNEIVTFSGF